MADDDDVAERRLVLRARVFEGLCLKRMAWQQWRTALQTVLASKQRSAAAWAHAKTSLCRKVLAVWQVFFFVTVVFLCSKIHFVNATPRRTSLNGAARPQCKYKQTIRACVHYSAQLSTSGALRSRCVN